MYQPDDNERKYDQVQPVAAKIHQRTSDQILFGMVLRVVALIVDGDDRCRGLSGTDSQKIFQTPIPWPAREGAAMNVIVFDDASNERQDAG